MKPTRRILAHALLAASIAAVGTAGALRAQPSAGADDGLRDDLERIRRATEAYHDVTAAHAAGYPTEVPPCIENPPEGGMGHHYVHPERMDDRLDVERPEILLYAPTAEGGLELTGVEYVVPYSARGPDEAPPGILGRDLERSDALRLWYLHVWVWEENAHGLFADWNPAVRCQEDVGDGEEVGDATEPESHHASHVQEEPPMDATLEASFEITGWEETDLVDDEGVRVYRTEVTKSFTGDLEGTSEAWLVMTTTPAGPAAYVGLEVLEVSVGERHGTFVLKHDATATGDGQEATWVVVPGSGTGDFADVAGTAQIERHDDGSHTLTLDLES